MGIFFTWHSSEHVDQLDVKWKPRDSNSQNALKNAAFVRAVSAALYHATLRISLLDPIA
jgi:hypothetical protein